VHHTKLQPVGEVVLDLALGRVERDVAGELGEDLADANGAHLGVLDRAAGFVEADQLAKGNHEADNLSAKCVWTPGKARFLVRRLVQQNRALGKVLCASTVFRR
jgi:hypothetical protein